MGWFSSTPEEKLLKAARKDKVETLRQLLDEHPELLDKKYSWNNGYDGFLLNYAAFHDSPNVIEFLITQKKADPNRNKDVGSAWTPLHHAEYKKSYSAAAKLLERGANPGIKNSKGANTRAFAASEKVRGRITPAGRMRMLYREIEEALTAAQQAEKEKREAAQKRKAEFIAQQQERERQEQERQRRIEGEWKLTAPAEVTFTRELPDGSHSLTDIFNFQTRVWRAVVTGLNGQGTAQNVIFFDNVPDPGILHGAFEKLKELGGKADESAIPGSLAKKPLRPAAQP